MPSHRIASRQAELARKKRKHHDAHPEGEALQASAGTTSEPTVATAPVPEEVRARPSLMSSYRAVSTPDSAKKTTVRSISTAQAEYFSADIRRLLVTISICAVLLVILTFVLR
ncbi:MAG: hypothetical protein EXR59_01485 [Dehalococcoidia bacterium]|nr:hypothetical protein [Dehalococcoidia bacterium]